MPNTSSSVFGHGRPPAGPDPAFHNHPTLSRLNRPVEATHLGQKTEYDTNYNPQLLVAVPRQENRVSLGIEEENLPFVGVDIWNAYEVSCLTNEGVPCVFILKLSYPSDSPSIVESKSLKLYLNSFNMTKVGSGYEETKIFLRAKIRDDLSALLETKVIAELFTPAWLSKPLLPPGNCLDDLLYDVEDDETEDIVYNEKPNLLVIEQYTEDEKYAFEEKPDPTLIAQSVEAMEKYDKLSEPQKGKTVSKKLYEAEYSNLLRSNCKVTHQPDWGTVVIVYKGQAKINRASLLKYIISFRNENHFHEEICETIYKRLYDLDLFDDLLVACFYTRRGGIDINPIRASNDELLKEICDEYIHTSTLSPKASRQ